MAGKRTHYRSYLMRLWQVQGAWRASLEDPHTGERLVFSTLERLFTFLSDQAATGEQQWYRTPGKEG